MDITMIEIWRKNMIYYDRIKAGAIVAKRQAQNSKYVKNLFGTGNTELLRPAQLEAAGLYVRVRPALKAGQAYTSEVVITDPIGTADEVREKTAGELAAELVTRREQMVVSRRQGRLAMRVFGILPSIEDYFSGLPEATPEKIAYKQDALIEWNDATEFRRTHAIVIVLLALLGFTPEQGDDLFIFAASISD